MRTNIVIDPGLLDAAMRAGPYKTKKDAVEAGLKLLARQASYREILRWEGKLRWDDSAGPGAPLVTGDDATVPPSTVVAPGSAAHPPAPSSRRHGRR